MKSGGDFVIRCAGMLNSDFERVVRQHQSMVFSIAFNFFRNASIAEEIAQDVFLQLFENLGSVGPDAHEVAWLRRTTTHRCIDVLRRARTRHEVQVARLPSLAVADPDRDPLLDERLWLLVASLPEKQRAVIVLRYGEDMDPREIGEMLQMPVNTVWSHLQRATALLREKAGRALMGNGRERIRTESA